MKFPDRSVLGTVTVEGAGDFDIIMQRPALTRREPLDVERLRDARERQGLSLVKVNPNDIREYSWSDSYDDDLAAEYARLEAADGDVRLR